MRIILANKIFTINKQNIYQQVNIFRTYTLNTVLQLTDTSFNPPLDNGNVYMYKTAVLNKQLYYFNIVYFKKEESQELSLSTLTTATRKLLKI
jgi:hypothetical protein